MTQYHSDPTRDDMLRYLQASCPGLDEFGIEEAIYWFAYNYHGGQWTNLYSALSVSPYRPSPLAYDNPDLHNDGYSALCLYYAGVESY